jgi:hypothetical protein
MRRRSKETRAAAAQQRAEKKRAAIYDSSGVPVSQPIKIDDQRAG